MTVNRRDFIKLGIAPLLLKKKLVFLISYNERQDYWYVSLMEGDVGDAFYFMELVLSRVQPNWRENPNCKHWKRYDARSGYCFLNIRDELKWFEAFEWATNNSGLKVEIIMENPFSKVRWSEVDIIAFDLFNTVFKLDRPEEEVKAYARHIHQRWAPLKLPQEWGELTLFEDSEEGLDELAKLAHTVTLTNAPLETQKALGCDRLFCELFSLENYEVFKPNPKAYRSLCKELRVKPAQVLMVTANEKFGDLEAAREVGMQSVFIDRTNKYGSPRTILELAQQMGRGLRSITDV